LRQVTPDAGEETRFVLIDAVGVTGSLKRVSTPMERRRDIGFDRLIEEIAAGRRDDDTLSTMASRLAALDRNLDDRARATVAEATGGINPKAVANRLLDATDPDVIAREACGPARRRRFRGPASGRRRRPEGRGLPHLRRSRAAPAAQGHQAPDRDHDRCDLDRCGDLLGL
jgi:hypothetical protein